jgi:hypothetical protein
MWGRKSPLSSEPSTPTVMSNAYVSPTNIEDENEYVDNPHFNPTPTLPESFKNPLSSAPTPTGNSNAFYNPNEAKIFKENPLYKPTPRLPEQPESFKSPTTPTVTSNAFYNPNKAQILNKNPPNNVPKRNVSLYKELPEGFKKVIEKYGTPVILNKNPPNNVPKRNVSLYKELPEGFKKVIEKYGTPVTIGEGGARRRTKYKRAKKRSLKSRKKSKV